jgi:basic membrane protein A and related proteins
MPRRVDILNRPRPCRTARLEESREELILRTNRLRWLALLMVIALVGAACGGDKESEEPSGGGTEETTSDLKVGVAFDIGGLGDQSFNDAAERGVQQAIDEGIISEENVERLEPDAEGTNRDQNVVNLADQGYDVILAIGFAFSPGIDAIAADYPDQFFAVVDGFAAEAPNVTNLAFKEQEGSFLVGAAAGLKTESNTVGFLGGQAGTGLIERFEAGYTAGVQEVNPDAEVLVEYIGDSTKAFNDPTKGEALSAKMYDGGADIVYHAAGASGAGLFSAAVDANKLAIGVDSDQSLTASPAQQKLILTSMLKRVDTAVYDVIVAVSEDNFTPGFQVFGLAEDGVDYAVNEFNDNDQLLSSDIQSQLDEFKQQIIDGEITVPDKP